VQSLAPRGTRCDMPRAEPVGGCLQRLMPGRTLFTGGVLLGHLVPLLSSALAQTAVGFVQVNGALKERAASRRDARSPLRSWPARRRRRYHVRESTLLTVSGLATGAGGGDFREGGASGAAAGTGV